MTPVGKAAARQKGAGARLPAIMAPDERTRRPPDIVIPPEARIPRARTASSAATPASPQPPLPAPPSRDRGRGSRGRGRGRPRGRGHSHRFAPNVPRGPPQPPSLPVAAPPSIRTSNIPASNTGVSRDPRKRPEHLKRRSEAATTTGAAVPRLNAGKTATSAETNSSPTSATMSARSKRSARFKPPAAGTAASQTTLSVAVQPAQDPSLAPPSSVAQASQRGVDHVASSVAPPAKPVTPARPKAVNTASINTRSKQSVNQVEPVKAIPVKTPKKSNRAKRKSIDSLPVNALQTASQPANAPSTRGAPAKEISANVPRTNAQAAKESSPMSNAGKAPMLQTLHAADGSVQHAWNAGPIKPSKNQFDNRGPQNLALAKPAKSIPATSGAQFAAPRAKPGEPMSQMPRTPPAKSASSDSIASAGKPKTNLTAPVKSSSTPSLGLTRTPPRKTAKNQQTNTSSKRGIRTVQSAKSVSNNANTSTPVGNAEATSPLNSVHPPRKAANVKAQLSTAQILSQAAASLQHFKRTSESDPAKAPGPSQTGAMQNAQAPPLKNPIGASHSTVPNPASEQSARLPAAPPAIPRAQDVNLVSPGGVKGRRNDVSKLSPVPKMQSAEARARIERDRRLQVRRIPVRRRSAIRATSFTKPGAAQDAHRADPQPVQASSSSNRLTVMQNTHNTVALKPQAPKQTSVQTQVHAPQQNNPLTAATASAPHVAQARARAESYTHFVGSHSPAVVQPQRYAQSPTSQPLSTNVQNIQTNRQTQSMRQPQAQMVQSQVYSSASHPRDMELRGTTHPNPGTAWQGTPQSRQYAQPRATNATVSIHSSAPPAPDPRPQPKAFHTQPSPLSTPLQIHTAKARAVVLAQATKSEALLQAQTSAAATARLQLAASIPRPPQGYMVSHQTSTQRPIQNVGPMQYQIPQNYAANDPTMPVRTAVQAHSQAPLIVQGMVPATSRAYAAHQAQLQSRVQHQGQVRVAQRHPQSPAQGQTYVAQSRTQVPPRTGFHAPTISRLPQASKAQINSSQPPRRDMTVYGSQPPINAQTNVPMNVVHPRTPQQMSPSPRPSPGSSSVLSRSPQTMYAQPVHTSQLHSGQNYAPQMMPVQHVQPRTPMQTIRQPNPQSHQRVVQQEQPRQTQLNYSSPVPVQPMNQQPMHGNRHKHQQLQSQAQTQVHPVPQPAASPQSTTSRQAVVTQSPSVQRTPSPAVSAPASLTSPSPSQTRASSSTPSNSRPPISSPDATSTLPTGPPPKHPKRSTGRPRGRPRGSKAKPGSRPRGRPRKVSAAPSSPAALSSAGTASSPGSETPSDPDSIAAAKPKRGRPKSQKTTEKERLKQERKMAEEKLLDTHEKKLKHMMAMNVKKRWSAEFSVHSETDGPRIEPLTKRQRTPYLAVQPVPVVSVALTGAAAQGAQSSKQPVHPLSFARPSGLSFAFTPIPRVIPSSHLSASFPAKLSLNVAPAPPKPSASSRFAMSSPARMAVGFSPAPRNISRPSFAAVNVAPTPRRVIRNAVTSSPSSRHNELGTPRKNWFDKDTAPRASSNTPKAAPVSTKSTVEPKDMEITPNAKSSDTAQLTSATVNVDSTPVSGSIAEKNDANVVSIDGNKTAETSSNKKKNANISEGAKKLSVPSGSNHNDLSKSPDDGTKAVSNKSTAAEDLTKQEKLLTPVPVGQSRNLKLDVASSAKLVKSDVSKKSEQQGKKLGTNKRRASPMASPAKQTHKRPRIASPVNKRIPSAEMSEAESESEDAVREDNESAVMEMQKPKTVLVANSKLERSRKDAAIGAVNSVLPERNAEQVVFNCLCDEEFEVVPSHKLEEIEREVSTGVGAGTVRPLDFWKWRLLCHYLCCPNANKPSACPRRTALLHQFKRADFNEVFYSS